MDNEGTGCPGLGPQSPSFPISQTDSLENRIYGDWVLGWFKIDRFQRS